MSTVGGGVVATDVRRSFGDVVAVDSMSLEVPPGTVTGLVGPNGAGKTTLLLVLASLLVPDSGAVEVAGWDPVRHPREVRRRTGWMPDTLGSYDALTALEALAFAAASFGIRGPAVEPRLRELLARVHLAEFADRAVHVLSRGQKQRLGLARALVHEPEVLLLDEPAAGLDPRSRVELRQLLRQCAADGCAVLVSSHVLTELEEMADRVVFVDRGRTVAQSAIAELAVESATWRIKALDQERLRGALDSLGVAWADGPAHGLDVSLRSEDDAAELLAALVREGVRVSGFAPATGTLEAAYLAMTQDRR